MSPIPWGAILTHGPTVLAAARSLLANQTRQARDQNQSVEAQIDQLEKASVESAQLLQQVAEQIQALTAVQQDLQRRLKLALIVAGISAAVAVAAIIVAIGR
jgi:type IV secretory pathway component VirB8